MFAFLKKDTEEDLTFSIKNIPNKKDEYEVIISNRDKKRKFSVSSLRAKPSKESKFEDNCFTDRKIK